MKQILLKTWLMVVCLLFGVGTMWAEEVVYKTATFTKESFSASVQNYTGNFSSTTNNFQVDLVNFNNNQKGWDYVKTGNKSNASVGTITTNAAIDEAVTKVTVTIDAVTASSVNSITLYSGTSASACTTSEGTFSVSTGAQAVSISSPSTNKFYKISFDCKKGSSNGIVQVSKVEYYYDNASDGGGTTPETPTVTAPTITTQPTSATYKLNASATNLTVAASGNPAPAYQWYSNTTNSNENGTKLDGATTASYKPSTATAGIFYYYCVATNSEGSATSNVATITVNEPVAATLPFSFDGGKSDIDSKDGMSQSGLGSDYSSSPKLKFDNQGDNVVINFNEAAKKVTYTIKGNSMSGTYAFEVKESADGVDYTTAYSHTSISDATSYTDNLKADSRFVKFVYTTKDGGNVALGNISIVAASVLDDPELAFEQSTYTFFTNGEMQVVATSSAGSTGAITYALTVGDADEFEIDENTGEIACYTAGTYTITANIAAAAGFANGTATCTVKVKEPVVGNSIIVAEAGGKYYAMTTSATSGYLGNKEIKKSGDKYVVESLDGILFCTNTTSRQTTIQSTSDAQYVQATAAKNISYTEDEYKWTNDGEKLTAATATYGSLQYNTSSPRFTTYATKVGQYATIVDLANVVVGDVVTLNAACTEGGFVYGTYSNATAWVVPNDLVVSEISIVDDALYVESYATGAVVPANTGVMVSAEKWDEGTKDFAVAFSNEAGTSVLGTDNALHPSSEPMTGNNLFYRLTMHNGTQIGFWWGAEGGAAFTLAANKAYLAVPNNSAGSNLRGLWFGGDETLTGIEAVETATDSAIYNLQGQRIQRLQQGVNIINGRKVIR